MQKRYSKKGMIALCALVYFVSYFSRKGFAAVMVEMLAEGVVDNASAGFIGMGLFVCYGTGQLISGYLGDKIKPQWLMAIGLATTALCNLLMPLMPNGLLMIPVWALNGLAQAMMWPPIVRILSDNLSHEQYVRANLIVTTAAHIATILLYLFVPMAIVWWNWQTVFFVASAAALGAMVVFLVALAFVLPSESAQKEVGADQPVDDQGEDVPKTSLRSMLLASGLFPVLGAIIACGFLRDGIETWLPTLYSEAFGRDSSESVLVSVLLPIFSVASITLITALHKRRFFNHELRGTMLLFVLSALLCVPLSLLMPLPYALTRIICLVLAALICAMMHAINFLLISCLPGRFARFKRASTVGGLVNAFVYIGAAASMYGIGWLAEHCGWAATALCWLGVAAAGMVLALAGYRAYTTFLKAEKK